MTVSLSDLVNGLNNALTPCQEPLEEREVQFTAFGFGPQLIKKLIEDKKVPDEYSEKESELFSQTFLTYAIVFGTTLEKIDDKILPQIVSSSSALCIYYDLLATHLDDANILIMHMNNQLGLLFQNSVSSDDVLKSTETVISFMSFAMMICAFADSETGYLPESFQISKTGEKFTEFCNLIQQLVDLCEKCRVTFDTDPQLVSQYQDEYVSLFQEIQVKIQEFSNFYRSYAEAIRYQFQPLFEEEPLQQFQEYMKRITNAMFTITFFATKISEYDVDIFQTVYAVLLEFTKRFYIINSNSTSLFRFRGNFNEYVEQIRAAAADIKQICGPLQAQMATTISKIPEPYQNIISQRTSTSFQSLTQLLASFDDLFDYILAALRSDKRFPLFESIHANLEGEVTRKAVPLIKSSVIIAFNLIEAEHDNEQILQNIKQIPDLCTKFFNDLNTIITNEKDEKKRNKLMSQRSIIEHAYIKLIEAVNFWVQTPTNTLVTSKTAFTAIYFVLSFCTLENDTIIVEALEEVRNTLAMRNGTFFADEGATMLQLIQLSFTKYADNEIATNVLKICLDIIKECQEKFPAKININDPNIIITCIKQNDNLATAAKAISGALPNTTDEEKSIQQVFDMFAFCFSSCSDGYRIALQLHFMQESEVFVRSLIPFDKIAAIGGEQLDEVRANAKKSIDALQAMLDNPPPYGVYDRKYLSSLAVIVQKGFSSAIKLLQAAQPILKQTADPESVKVAILQLNTVLKVLFAMMPYINAVFDETKVKVPAINGLLLKKSTEDSNKLILKCKEKLNNHEACNNTEIVGELFNIATQLDSIPALKGYAETFRAKATEIDSASTRASLGDNTASDELVSIMQDIVDLEAQIDPISTGLVEAVRVSGGDSNVANNQSKNIEVNTNKMPTIRPVQLESLEQSQVDTVKRAVDLEPCEAIKEIKAAGIDAKTLPAELGAKNLSTAVTLAEQTPLIIKVDTKDRKDLTQEQVEFLENRAKLSETPDFVDQVATSTLNVLRNSNINQKANGKFNQSQVDYIYRTVAESANATIAAQHKQSLISDGVCIITAESLEKCKFNPEQTKAVISLVSSHVPPLTTEDNEKNQKIIADTLEQCKCTPEQKEFVTHAIQAVDCQAIRNKLSNITNEELQALNIPQEKYQLVQRYLNQNPQEPISLENEELQPEQIQALDQRLNFIKASSQSVINNLAAANKHIISLNTENLIARGIKEDDIPEANAIVESVIKAVAEEQESIASKAAFDLASVNLTQNQLSHSNASAVIANAAPVTLVEAGETPSAKIVDLSSEQATIDTSIPETPEIASLKSVSSLSEAKNTENKNVLIIERAPAKEEIEKFKAMAIEGPEACGLLEKVVCRLEKDAATFTPLAAEVQKTPENEELVGKANAIGERIQDTVQALEEIKTVDLSQPTKISTGNLLTLQPASLKKVAPIVAVQASKAIANLGYDEQTIELINDELAQAITTLSSEIESSHIIQIASEIEHKDPGLIALDSIDAMKAALKSNNIAEIVSLTPRILAGSKISSILEANNLGDSHIANQLIAATTKVKAQGTVNEEDNDVFNELIKSMESMIEERVAGPNDVSDETIPDFVMDLTSSVVDCSNELLQQVKSDSLTTNSIMDVKSKAMDIATTALIAASKRIGSADVSEEIEQLMKSITNLENSIPNGSRAIGKANRDVTLSLNKLADTCDEIIAMPKSKPLECDKFEQTATQMMKEVARITRLSSAKNKTLAERTFKKVKSSLQTTFAELKSTVAKTKKADSQDEIEDMINGLEATFSQFTKPEEITIDTAANSFSTICQIRRKMNEVMAGDSQPHPELVAQLPYRFTPKVLAQVDSQEAISSISEQLSNFLSAAESVTGNELIEALNKFQDSLSLLYANARVNEVLRAGDQAIIIVKSKLLGDPSWHTQSKQLRSITDEAIAAALKAKAPDNAAQIPLEESISTLETSIQQLQILQQKASAIKAKDGPYVGYDLVYAVTPVVSTIKTIVEKAAAQNQHLKKDFDLVIEQCKRINTFTLNIVSAVRDAVDSKPGASKVASENAVSIGRSAQELSSVYQRNGGNVELTNAMMSLSANVSKTAERIASVKETIELPKKKQEVTSTVDAPRRNNLLERLKAEAKVVEARRKLENAKKALAQFSGKK